MANRLTIRRDEEILIGYVFEKELTTVIYRRDCPNIESGASKWIYGDPEISKWGRYPKPKPLLTVERIEKEVKELTATKNGKHPERTSPQWDLHRDSIPNNVCHEVADCLYFLMVNAVALGSSGGHEEWVKALLSGMRNPDAFTTEEAEEKVESLKSIEQEGKIGSGFSEINFVVRVLGANLADYGMGPRELSHEIIEPQRWTKKNSPLRASEAAVWFHNKEPRIPAEKVGLNKALLDGILGIVARGLHKAFEIGAERMRSGGQ